MSLTNKISITWNIDDVLSVRPHLTKVRASYILEALKQNHDANVGINWDVIKVISDILFPE